MTEEKQCWSSISYQKKTLLIDFTLPHLWMC